MPVTPHSEAGGSGVQGQPGLHETVSKKKGKSPSTLELVTEGQWPVGGKRMEARRFLRFCSLFSNLDSIKSEKAHHRNLIPFFT